MSTFAFFALYTFNENTYFLPGILYITLVVSIKNQTTAMTATAS